MVRELTAALQGADLGVGMQPEHAAETGPADDAVAFARGAVEHLDERLGLR